MPIPIRWIRWLGFGELYIKPTDTLQVTLGLRYTDDIKKAPYNPLPLDNRAKGWSNVNVNVNVNVNATLTLASLNDGLEVQAFARNLFDSKAITAVSVNGASLGLTRQVYYLDPRTFGLSLTKNF